ncbi:MAG: SGNH/GDSL hydrolase family protein [Chrysiogenales bacterium]|nr:MAG: SGNH/GDSL hydrolase family protein [Chrysiogenales bacterium]
MELRRTKSKLSSGTPVRIVALGDSLTQGWMVRKGYLEFLREMLAERYISGNVIIVNRGVPGDTAEGGLMRLGREVLDADPDLVFVQFGLNDAYTGVSPERYQRTISTIVDRILADTDAEVLLVTSVPLMHGEEDFMAESYYSRIEAVAEERGLPVARVHRYWKRKISGGVDFRSLVQGDGVHPNIEGYRLMAEAIMEKL